MAVSTYQEASGADTAVMKELEQQTRENVMNVRVTATCIRVPVMRGHAESVSFQFENPLDEYHIKVLTYRKKGIAQISHCNVHEHCGHSEGYTEEAQGVVMIDNRASNHFLTPLEVLKKDNVVVGRIPRDISQYGDYG
ncbi:hypothetical protein Nepgr_003801 [Nepenthes gracilis]|uniref:Semialdehyde dehydrogenase dimerisation domain-containing protein n=1 Tax=Nepenthes gracilis TaxID=150966 RepID=A0AAD3XE94_NEPGR|nr:hypothetical protein Nepgr_003801 [Nepenthes gracilis]